MFQYKSREFLFEYSFGNMYLLILKSQNEHVSIKKSQTTRGMNREKDTDSDIDRN